MINNEEWNENGINKKTGTRYDEDGYDEYGYNEYGYDRDGYDRYGYDIEGYDIHGWDSYGINKKTGRKYDENGYDYCGYDIEGYDKNGWREDGTNKKTKTRYDEKGYDKYENKNPKYTPNEVEDAIEVKESDVTEVMGEIIESEKDTEQPSKKIYIVGQKITISYLNSSNMWEYSSPYNEVYQIYSEEKKNEAIKKYIELKEEDVTDRSEDRLIQAYLKESYLDKKYEPKDITEEILKEIEESKEERNSEKQIEEKEVNTIDIEQLGLKIGMEAKEQTLPNGKQVKSLVWDKENLIKAVNAVKHLSEEGKPVIITGAAPAWLVSALTHTVHPCPVSVYMPQIGKNVDIPKLAHGEANKEGEVAFKTTEKGDSVLIEYNMDLPEGITTYDENNLSKVIVPEVSQGKAVYLSGRGPNYLTVAIAEAYAHTNSSVSLYQPGVGYTCSITHSRNKKLGDLDKDPLGQEQVIE